MPAARILVVEDEPAIRDAVAAALRAEGLRVCERPDGADLEATVDGFLPDMAILDVMLPGPRDGFALARTLRQDSDLPILFLSARDAASARLQGFAAGADDYVVKPFVLEELLARTRALLRRSGRLQTSAVEVGDLVVDEDSGLAVRAGHRLELTSTELRLVSYLARNRGRILSKLQILTQVWGYDDYDPNLVEVHVSALRRKLEAHGPRLIATVWGQGYVMRPARP